MIKQEVFPNVEPLARNSDEITSHIAAAKLTHSGRRDSQKSALLHWMLAKDIFLDTEAMTSFEIAAESGMDRYVVARRLPDLLDDGYVKKARHRNCRVTGELAVTWKLPVKLLGALEEER